MEVVVPRRRVSNNMEPGSLSRILRRLRSERGWNQDDVAMRAGLRQPYYSSLETGAIQRPGADKLEALDKAFELETGSLGYWLEHGPPWAGLGENGPGYDVEPRLLLNDDKEIVALLRRLPPHRQDEVAEILRRQAIAALKVMTRDETA
jgi:transcriptional regulator with XRE-family HTH domain